MQVISGNTVQAAPGYNETEIRFHIVDPIIRKFGYPDHDNVYLNLANSTASRTWTAKSSVKSECDTTSRHGCCTW